MTELNKYTFGEFLNIPDKERDFYCSVGTSLYALPLDKPDMLEWEWARVKQIQDIVCKKKITYDEMIEAVMIGSMMTEEEINKKYWYEVFHFYNFILKELAKINELEKQLVYEPDVKELNAGIEDYNVFGWFCTIDRLAGGDPLKYEAVGKLKYADIFAKLKLNNLDIAYQRRLIKQNNQNV